MGYQALLFCPDEKTARAVSQVLSELDFSIEPCTEPFGAVKKLMARRFDAIVVDCDNEQNAMLLFKSARNSGANQAALAVAVVEGQAGVAKAFRIGANLVLTKPINVEQAKGTLRVARGLLRKGSEAIRPTASPGSVRTNVPPASAAPPRGQVPAIPPARSTTPAARPPKATSPSIVAPLTGDARDQDPRKTPVPAGVHEASQAVSTAPAKSAYPWQRAARPAAAPTAPAVRKAAETVSPEPTHAAGIRVPSAPPAPAARPTGASHTLAPVAAAPATAKEKEMGKPSDVTATSLAPQPPRPKPQIMVETGTEPEAPATKTLVHPYVESASFPLGSSDWGEEEEGSNKKALVIVAAVVLLAASAAYLGWKNTGMKHPVQPSVSSSAGTQTAPEVGTDSKPEDSTPAGPTESADASGDSSRMAPTAKTSPAIKAHGKESSAAVPEPPKQEPAAEPLVVKRDKSSATAAAASAGSTEPVQPPSTVGVVASGDTKELANISNVAVAVPKPVAQVVRISQGVSEGLILKKVAPNYPPQALQLRLQGSVEMQATISKQGNITDLKVLTGDSMLAHAAQEAVKQWKYKPFYLNGEPVDVQTMITVNFKLPN